MLSSRLRVLLIDDDQSLRSSLARLLSRTFDVTAVASVRSALELIDEEQPFDAVLCDWNVGTENGEDFIVALMSKNPRLAAKTAIMSGSLAGHSGDIGHALACRWLAKPMRLPVIVDMVHRLAKHSVAPPPHEARAHAV